MRARFLFAAALGFACAPGAVALGNLVTQSVEFYDGDFAPGDYLTLPSGTGTSAVTTDQPGGNPGSFRRISITLDPFDGARNVQLYKPAEFTPADQGPITAVSLSYDIRRVFTSHPWATWVLKGLAVQQLTDGAPNSDNGDGDGYTVPVLHTYRVGVTQSTEWEHMEVLDILPLFPGVNWVDGGPITFGFYALNATSETPFTLDTGYDNFRVGISYVPEPGALSLLAVGAVTLVLVRRRRR
jgi:hypothetical protein